MSRKVLLIAVIALVLLLALGGFYLYLMGGLGTSSGAQVDEQPQGIEHVRSTYVDGEGENLYRPVGLGVAVDGRFAVTLRDTQKVVLFEENGDWIRTWGERGISPGGLIAPLGTAFDAAADHVYVTDRSRLRLIAYSSQGRYLWETPLLNPLTPVVHEEGVLVTTFGPLVKLTAQGELEEEVGSRGLDPGQFDYPRGAAVLANGDVIVADSNNARVQRIELSGTTTATVDWVYGTPPAKQDDPDALFGLPSGVALDDERRAYVLDGFRHTITVLDSETGEELHKFENLEGETDGRFNLPTSISHLSGNLFVITDTYNDRVRIVRILMPGEDNVVARNPQLLWLLLLLLLPLFFLFGRKRWYATDAAVEQAEHAQALRLLASIAKSVRVTPEAHQKLAEAVEADIEVGRYFVAVGEAGGAESANDRLVAALPTGLARLLLPRVRIVCATASESDSLAGRGRKTVLLAELAAEYTPDGEQVEVEADNAVAESETSEDAGA